MYENIRYLPYANPPGYPWQGSPKSLYCLLRIGEQRMIRIIVEQAWEIRLILHLQQSGEWLIRVMEGFSWLGYPQAYLILVAAIYWGLDRRLGLRMAFFLPLSASLNCILKQAFHAPRPYWVDRRIIPLHAENGFGMPSGHAQSVVGWLIAAADLKRSWFWIMSLVIITGVGLSRVFLGVHFPLQVIAGWLAGILVLICFLRYEHTVIRWFSGIRPAWQLLLSLGFTILILAAAGIFIAFLDPDDLPAQWVENAAKYRTLSISGLKAYGMASAAGNAGSLLGVAAGAVLMARAGAFQTGGAWWVRSLRILIGISFMILLYAGFQAFSPEDGGGGADPALPLLSAVWRFSGFLILSFSAIFLIPLILIRLRLLERAGS